MRASSAAKDLAVSTPGSFSPLRVRRSSRSTYPMATAPPHATKNVNIEVKKGEILGLVGESGSGKSTVGNAIINLIDEPGKVSSGSVILGDLNIHENSESIVKYRGNKIGLIFQDPQTSLNPILTVGEQLIETIQTHLKLSKEEAKNKSINLLKEVGIKDAEVRFDNYPHQFSGGMRQRVMIAIALACDPKVLIADEPTTALDVTIQAQILDIVKRLRKELGMAIIWITHDLGVVAGIADRVAVMYGGFIVEQAPVKKLYSIPKHPYTQRLLSTLPKLEGERTERLESIKGQPPDLHNIPDSCPFAPRCIHVSEKCQNENPRLEMTDPEHQVACWWNTEKENF